MSDYLDIKHLSLLKFYDSECIHIPLNSSIFSSIQLDVSSFLGKADHLTCLGNLRHFST